MKTKLTGVLVSSAVALIFSAGLISQHQIKNPIIREEAIKEAKEESQEISGYLNWLRERYADPVTKQYNIEAISASRDALAKFRANAKTSRAFPNLSWTERGPNDVGGRLRAICIDKNNPNKLFAAAAGGGLFVSSDNAQSWAPHPQSDTLPSMQGSWVTQSINGDIYFSTGEGFTGTNAGALIEGGSALPGDGIFKSNDGGVTFKQLNKTRPTTNGTGGWAFITKVVCHPTNNDIVYAATMGGLQKSIDGGATWGPVSSGGLNSSTKVMDVEITPNGNMIVGTTTGLCISNDGGNTFTINRWGNNGLPNTSLGRTTLAYAPSNPNHLYLIAIKTNPSWGTEGIYESTDFGATWTTMISGGGTFEPFGTPPPNPTNQGFWGVTLAVNPANEFEFYLGGMQDLYRYTPAQGFKPVAFWQGNPGFGQNIHSDIHDVVYDVVNPNRLFISTDGGAYRCLNASATSPIFAEKNNGMNTLQILMCDANLSDKMITGSQDNGTSYIGDEANSPLASRQIGGGDGGICGMSDVFPDVVFGSVSYNSDLKKSVSAYHTDLGGLAKSLYDRNVDGGFTLSGGIYIPSSTAQDGKPDDQVAPNNAIWSMPMDFKENFDMADSLKITKRPGAPVIYDTVKVSYKVNINTVIVIGTYNNLWFTQKGAEPNVPQPAWFSLKPKSGSPFNFTARRFTAVHIAPDGKAIYAAGSNNRVYRVTGIDLFNTDYAYKNTKTDSFNNQDIKIEDLGIALPSVITSIITDDNDGQTMILTTSNYGAVTNHVVRIDSCRNGSLPRTFTSIVGNLPPMPVNSAVFIPKGVGASTGKNMIVLGTESGIWGSNVGGTTWSELNNMDPNPDNWHPRVPVSKVLVQKLNNASGVALYSGTHGRGMFSSKSLLTMWPTATKDIVKNTQSISIYPNPVTDQATISFDSKTASNAVLQIVSMSGAVISQKTYVINSGENKVVFATNNLAKGAYIASLIVNGERLTKTFIK
jgi:Secretion system C-terminal sorting domain